MKKEKQEKPKGLYDSSRSVNSDFKALSKNKFTL